MRAVVLVTGRLEEWPQLAERTLACLLPLGDRPFIRHVVESLVESGVTELDMVISQHARQVEQLLGDGSRWGIRLRHHLVRDPDRPCDCIRRLAARAEDETLLLAHADTLVLDLSPPMTSGALEGAIAACTSEDDLDIGLVQWTGWAWVPASLLATLPPDRDASELEYRVVESARREGIVVEVGRPLRAAPLTELVDSQRRVLRDGGGLLLTGREQRAGVRVARGVTMDGTARLVPPVFVGENTRIGASVRLGPNVSVGEGCVLDDEAVVSDAVIRSGAYVGRGVEVRDCVVDGDLVVHLRVGAELAVADDFLLAHVGGASSAGWRSLASRLLSALALVATAPLLALLAGWLRLTRPGPLLRRRDVVLQPGSPIPEQWRTAPVWTFEETHRVAPEPAPSDVVLRILPGLLAVVQGHLDLVGVPARTLEELQALPDDWRAICLSARAGLISEALVRHGPFPAEDEAFAADALQAVRGGLGHDISLFLEYIRIICRRSSETSTAEPRMLRPDRVPEPVVEERRSGEAGRARTAGPPEEEVGRPG